MAESSFTISMLSSVRFVGNVFAVVSSIMFLLFIMMYIALLFRRRDYIDITAMMIQIVVFLVSICSNCVYLLFNLLSPTNQEVCNLAVRVMPIIYTYAKFFIYCYLVRRYDLIAKTLKKQRGKMFHVIVILIAICLFLPILNRNHGLIVDGYCQIVQEFPFMVIVGFLEVVIGVTLLNLFVKSIHRNHSTSKRIQDAVTRNVRAGWITIVTSVIVTLAIVIIRRRFSESQFVSQVFIVIPIDILIKGCALVYIHKPALCKLTTMKSGSLKPRAKVIVKSQRSLPYQNEIVQQSQTVILS